MKILRESSTAARLVLYGLCALGFVACDSKQASRTPQMIMYEVDYADRKLAALLGKVNNPATLPNALEEARKIEAWMSDPVIESYPTHRNFRGDAAEFQKLRADFRGALGEVIRTAEEGNANGFKGAYPRMRMQCEVCHVKFRPDVRKD